VVIVIVISTEIQKSHWSWEIRVSYSGVEDVSIVGCYTMPIGEQVLTIKRPSAFTFRLCSPRSMIGLLDPEDEGITITRSSDMLCHVVS